jgi:hypothetical protein
MIKNLKTKFAMLFKNTSLDEIEQRASEIVRSDSRDVDKQQKLYNLAKELGLPIDSSDVHCRRLSYTEMYDHINNWIKDRRAEKYTRINVYATFISVLLAMFAVLVSIFIHWQTRQLQKPMERPIISIIDNNCKGEPNDDTAKLEFTLNIIVKNIGEHPAGDLRMRVWGTPVEEPNNLKMIYDKSMSDPFFPGIQGVLPPPKITCQRSSLGDEIFFFVKINYKDEFFQDKEYAQNFYLIYEIGKDRIPTADLSIKKKFESYLEKAGAL